MDKRVTCAKDTYTGEQWIRENKQHNSEQQSEVPTTTRNKNVDDDLLTRLKNMEKNINKLMTYVEDIIQINKDHQEGRDKKIDHLFESLMFWRINLRF